jgi:di/tricarboxylate transporter
MFVVGSIGRIGGIPFEMEKAAMLAAGLNLLCGFVSPREAYKVIQWDLVVLIGSSFGLGAAMESTGLAKDIAGGIVEATATGGPKAALFMMYGVTLLLTELISNNAAAALVIPVAINMAQQLGVRHEPFVLSICIACTAAFALPLGYQTHLMVMAPGRYTQRDFLKVGLGLDLIYWVVIAGLAPYVWGF